MTHTPSFSKRINNSLLIAKRIHHDLGNRWHNRTTIVSPIQGMIEETSAQHMIYSDFYQRTKKYVTPLSLYVSPRVHSLTAHYMNNESFVRQYSEDYLDTKKQLEFLGVTAELYHLYHPTVLSAVKKLDNKLIQDHRAGIRSDVVYYNIQDGRVVPDHRIIQQTADLPEYVVRFFLNSNKETLSGIIHNPYDIFGCVALLVNPHDKRYKKARGRDIILPITNRSVPVIPYEWISVEWFGTRILVPAHNREDFKIALELWLPLDVYAFDKFGKFTTYAKDFSGKLLTEFNENVIKFLDDISNLESINIKKIIEYRDKYTWKKLYPLLEKNIYIWLWYQSLDDGNFIQKDEHYNGNIQILEDDISREENFCISNQDPFQPSLQSFIWDEYNGLVLNQNKNLVEDIIIDFYMWGLLHLPVKWEDMIEMFSLQYNGEYLWQMFFTLRTQSFSYTNSSEIWTLLEAVTEHIPTDEQIDQILEYIDLGWYFLHTKQGYIKQEGENFHYDNEYIALALLISQAQSSGIDIIFSQDETTFSKYFLYLYYFTKREPVNLNSYSLEDKKIFWTQWGNIQKMMPDVVRILLLQSSHHAEHDIVQTQYSWEQIEMFINKRWNLARIIPCFEYDSLSTLSQDVLSLSSQMHDYDRYIISTLHELYDEVVFLVKKHHTDQIISIVISTLWDKIADILLYIVKVQSSPVSDKVAYYALQFANHLLYPLMPTMMVWLFENLGMQRSTTFFEEDPTFLVNKNIKCNFLIQFVNYWYWITKTESQIKGFILQANKDFLDYAKGVLSDFYEFLGKEYVIELIDEHQDRPEWIESHRVFAMQWWVLRDQEAQEIIKPIIEIQDSLWILKKQLSYKQQLLQTIKNTLIRLRTTGQKEKISQFQTQIEDLEREITHIEYQISKLKYF